MHTGFTVTPSTSKNPMQSRADSISHIPTLARLSYIFVGLRPHSLPHQSELKVAAKACATVGNVGKGAVGTRRAHQEIIE